MKQGFQIIGILSLVVGSFIYSEKVDMVAKLNDDLLTTIENKSPSLKQKPVESIITKDTIIPGINGKKVDIVKSYQNMKEVGYYNEKLIEYEPIKVKEPLSKNKDKFIIRGPNEKNIFLIFKIKDTNIETIKKVLNKNKITASFFINSNYLEKNYNEVIRLIKSGHTIGNLSKNEDYLHSDFNFIKTIVTNASGGNNYCLSETKNKEILKQCQKEDSYTIMTKTIKNNHFINVKKNLTKGAIISLETNKELNKEIQNIVNYIISKGYKIKPLESLVE